MKKYRLLMVCPPSCGEIKPGFYHACAEKIFPEYGIETIFLPDLRSLFIYGVIRRVSRRPDLAELITTVLWVFKHRKSFDLIVAWHGAGAMIGVVRAILGLKTPQLCLILYRLYNPDAKKFSGFMRRFLLRIMSRGVDFIFSIDRGQALDFAERLGRTQMSTLSFEYGVDFEWFGKYAKSFSVQPKLNRIFSPGSAYRDDNTLFKAVADFDVEIWRAQMEGNSEIRSERLGKALLIKAQNRPYPEYISACLESAIVVISAHSHDKPVGLTALLECMSLGKPVIISRGLSSLDYIEEGVTALAFEQGDIEMLRDHINRLLHDPEFCRTISQNAVNSIISKYDLSVTGPNFAKLLLSVIPNR